MAERDTCSSASSCSRESCEGCPSANGGAGAQAQPDFRAELNPASVVDHVIGVVSGKGGVGKSLVAASLANGLAAQGYRVGILDADITGPSIPKMYGLSGPAEMVGDYIVPAVADNEVKVMSLNLLMPDPEQAVVWRGPVIAGVVKQFWTDVVWGAVDYLLVDMPPGTGDVPLTVFQSLPVDGIVIVTSPQDLVQMIVRKAYNMADIMKIPVLGVVENYSCMLCPHCGEKIYPFGESHVREAAEAMNLPVLGEVPMDPALAAAADAGAFASVTNEHLADALEAIRKV